MTGGRVVVLGPTGRNFAAGMSAASPMSSTKPVTSTPTATPRWSPSPASTDAEEIETLRHLIDRHAHLTHSQRAFRILALWENYVPMFVKVLPKDYSRVLQALERIKASGLTGDEAAMAAFEDNIRDAARITGG
jgi:glutamate synthase (ferredoxin)